MLPCSCFAWLVCVSTSVYQPCRGPQADTTCPEPSAFSAVPLSTVGHLTVGHSTFGPGPSQCDPLTTMGRQTVGTQSGPYGCQLRSSSPTPAGAHIFAIQTSSNFDILLHCWGNHFGSPSSTFSSTVCASHHSQFLLYYIGREHGHPYRN